MYQKFIVCLILSNVMMGTTVGGEITRWDSPRKSYRLKVEAGSDANASKRGAANAKGTLYRLDKENERYIPVVSFGLANPIAPEKVFVAEDGKYFVTINDLYFDVPGSRDLVIYDAQGTILGSYSLGKLFSAVEIRNFEGSVIALTRDGASRGWTTKKWLKHARFVDSHIVVFPNWNANLGESESSFHLREALHWELTNQPLKFSRSETLYLPDEL